MTDEQRIERLERKRAELKKKIRLESARRFPDELALRRLKVENCRLKDEIELLRPGQVGQAAVA